MELITCAEAKRQGLNKFYNGLVCQKGHLEPRYVHNGCCVKCQSMRSYKTRKLKRARDSAARPLECEVCGDPPTTGHKVLFQDHCHATGVKRGLLCNGCNMALGGAKDRPHVLRALAIYLEKHHPT